VRCAIEAAAGGAACWAALLLAAPAWLRAFAAHPRIAARWQLAALLLSSAVCLPLAYSLSTTTNIALWAGDCQYFCYDKG
jgi:hypothetical protein